MTTARTGMVAIILALAACSTASAPGPTGPGDRPTLPMSPSATALPDGLWQVVDLGEPVWGAQSAGETFWVEGGEGGIHQLDGASGDELQSLPGSWPVVQDGKLWYVRDDALVEANATTGKQLASYHPPVLGTAVHDRILWAADEETGILSRVDLASNRIVHRTRLPAGEPKWVGFWEGAIWVVIDGSDVLVRVDPESGRIVDKIKTGTRPHSVAIAFGSLWVTDHGQVSLERFGPDGDHQAVIEGPGLNVAITATADAIWAASPDGVMKIDPSTNSVVKKIPLGYGEWYAAAATSQGFVWLTSADGGRLYQVDGS